MSNEEQHSPELLTLSEAGARLPHAKSASTLWRWQREGCATSSGDRVHLKCCRLGRHLYTTLDWVIEFGVAVAAAETAASSSTVVCAGGPTSPPRGRFSSSDSERFLDAVGIGTDEDSPALIEGSPEGPGEGER